MINPTKNGKELVKICRGGQTIWQKPQSFVALNNVGVGFQTISGRAYPNDATIEVEVKRNGQVIFTGTPRLRRLEFVQVLKDTLKEDDEVTVRVTAQGFTPSKYSTSVY